MLDTIYQLSFANYKRLFPYFLNESHRAFYELFVSVAIKVPEPAFAILLTFKDSELVPGLENYALF